MTTYPVEDILLWWAFTEAKTQRASEHAPSKDFSEMVFKITCGGIVFSNLGDNDKILLLKWIKHSREPLISAYMGDIDHFMLEYQTKAEIRNQLCLSQIDPTNQGQFLPLSFYCDNKLNGFHEPEKLRKENYDPLFYRENPVILGVYNHNKYLIDGMHLCVAFCEYAVHDDIIGIYVPLLA